MPVRVVTGEAVVYIDFRIVLKIMKSLPNRSFQPKNVIIRIKEE
jgi:hypothetical protein